ncbi:hypothetical protein PLESTF_001140600 [Pleodorina starrii]|nr:hypothetical protein PLESTF_001140600 [Pleodorina starrii]
MVTARQAGRLAAVDGCGGRFVGTATAAASCLRFACGPWLQRRCLGQGSLVMPDWGGGGGGDDGPMLERCVGWGMMPAGEWATGALQCEVVTGARAQRKYR